MWTSDNQSLFESYRGLADMQQRSSNNSKYAPGADLKNSNMAQFGGLAGRGTPNAARMSTSADLSSDEEDVMVEVKGYGVMKKSQLKGLIKKLAQEIQQSLDRGVYNVTDKADLLTLFSKTYSG
jgi:hypothetical protein